MAGAQHSQILQDYLSQQVFQILVEVFREEREDIFCPRQATVHDVPGEAVQGRHQL